VNVSSSYEKLTLSAAARARSKKSGNIHKNLCLANVQSAICLGLLRFRPNPYPPAGFMILVAIFSVIVLLMCWLCYSGDCNN